MESQDRRWTVISSLPLLLFRRVGWFQLGTPKSSSRLGLFLLIPLLVYIGFTYTQCMYLNWNIYYSIVIGLLLACLTGIAAPFLSPAILAYDIDNRSIFVAVVVGCMPGIYAANRFAMRGPGAAGVVSLWFESIGGSMAAMSLVIAVFFHWRWIGVRYVTKTCAANEDQRTNQIM
ncbi:MAG: hypothetical protein R3C28_19420 [Pirellulaceae bacterium]